MTYDDARGVTLLFGGGNRERGFGDLWAWDGTRWQLLTAAGPSARNSMVFAFDSKRQRAVLHGGRTADGVHDDTWEWDGTRWTDRKVAGPGLRLHHHGAYDPRRGRLVIYGGLRPVETRRWNRSPTRGSGTARRGPGGTPSGSTASRRRWPTIRIEVRTS